MMNHDVYERETAAGPRNIASAELTGQSSSLPRELDWKLRRARSTCGQWQVVVVGKVSTWVRGGQ